MRRTLLLVSLAVAAIIVTALFAAGLRAQTPPKPDPAAALSDALTAACRQDAPSFAAHLTGENAAAYRQIPQEQQTALLRRFVLLDDPGKPLLSTTAEGHPVMRCEAGGVVSEMRFGATESGDNLSFIPVEVPQAPAESRSVRFGLVREGGDWKLLSVGLLLIDIPALAEQWEEEQLADRETQAVAALKKIAAALEAYRTGYGRLPESLDQLGPAAGGATPERAGLLDESLASGQTADYRFRYTIVPAAGQADDSERDKLSGFSLAAAPASYPKSGRRSFLLDSAGVLHGADKHGAVATTTDPRLDESAH